MQNTIELAQILEFLGPTEARVLGPSSRKIDRPAALDETEGRDTIGFCSKSGAGAIQSVSSACVGTILCGEALASALSPSDVAGKTLIVVSHPRLSFLRVVRQFFADPKPAPGIHPSAVVDPDAKIAPDVHVGPFTCIGKCSIESGTIIYGHVHIYSQVQIGRNVVVHSGTVIGADGFGYQQNEEGEWEKFPHIGGVIIEDDVEIGANTCIDRGTLGNTHICQGVRIDNLVHIGHNVHIGRHSLIIAEAMIGGSTNIGEHVWVAPSACVREHTRIGSGSVVGLGSVVLKDVPERVVVVGNPARVLREIKDTDPGARPTNK